MLTIHDLTYAYDNGNPVLYKVNLKVEQGEIFCLLGPSGCGKTTLLRTVAGLESPTSGTILVDGERINDMAAHTRGFGLMFQSYALFPHMNVRENVTFGLKMRNVSKADREQRVQEVLELVGLQGLEERRASQLSGGQRQRVALARSLAPNPRLLMLDEPLGSLDESLSRHLLIELRRIIKNIGLTAIYVTHNQQEAFAIGDRVGIMNEGRIEQIGKPIEIYQQPKTVFTARFLGLNNIVPVEERERGLGRTIAGEFMVEPETDAILIHPRGVALAEDDAPHSLTGDVVESSFQRGVFFTQVKVAPDIVFTLELPSSTPNPPRIGDHVALTVAADAAIPLRGVI